MKLIDKDALVAEIDRQKIGYNVDGKHSIEYDITRKILNIINTLEVKEVNLEKELNIYLEKVKETDEDIVFDFAKHFFELGMQISKAQKGE